MLIWVNSQITAANKACNVIIYGMNTQTCYQEILTDQQDLYWLSNVIEMVTYTS